MAKTKTAFATRPQYKCRKCGKVFLGRKIYEISSDLISSFYNTHLTDEQLDYISELTKVFLRKDDPFRHTRIDMYDSHICEDGGVGISDLIGFEKSVELPIRRGSLVQPKEVKDG